MVKVKLILLVVVISLLGCNETRVQPVDIDNYKYYLLIPVHGCGGCVQKARAFANNHLGNKNLGIIFINFTTEKDAKLAIGEEFYNSKEIIIDRSNYLYNCGFDTTYPSIILNSERREVMVLKPDIIESKLLELDSLVRL